MVANEDTRAAATWLAGGLTLFTASLGAVGGLNGGIARMFRNNGLLLISMTIGIILVAVGLAVISRLWLPDNGAAVHSLLIASTVLFAAGTILALNLMVKSSHTRDRPELKAQLVSTGQSQWVLKVQASSSGLDADDQLLVLIYAQPKAPRELPWSSQPIPPTVTPKRNSPSPSPPETPAPRLDGDRLFFAQAGPSIEGLASQTVELPIPTDRGYESIVITAVLDDFPRNCEGVTVNVRDYTELMVPPEIRQDGKQKRNGTLSCVTIATPPKATASPSAAAGITKANAAR